MHQNQPQFAVADRVEFTFTDAENVDSRGNGCGAGLSLQLELRHCRGARR